MIAPASQRPQTLTHVEDKGFLSFFENCRDDKTMKVENPLEYGRLSNKLSPKVCNFVKLMRRFVTRNRFWISGANGSYVRMCGDKTFKTTLKNELINSTILSETVEFP
uniref:Uncharacterized protein n=1 Tax=Romanomermis culicivorax TaxID=13658 RepID=A0A915IQ14_ROMCU